MSSTASSVVAPGSLWGEEGTFDSILLSIMRSCGKIQPFFECIFSFLSRRTDFYIILEDNHPDMGFPPGVALNIVIQAFKKFEVLTRKREAELMREAETRRIDLMADDVDAEQQIIDSPSSNVEQLNKLAKFKSNETSLMSDVSPGHSDEVFTGMSSKQPKMKVSHKSSINQLSGKATHPVTSDVPLNELPSQVADSKSVTNMKPINVQENKSSLEAAEISSDAYNGATNENYVWSQTMTDIDIRVSVPKGTTGKDLKVNIKNDSLKIEILTPERQVLLEGKLLNRVKVEESMWSLDKGAAVVHINMEKNKEIMWKSVFLGEESIDLTKVDTSRDISEFDQESQAAIQKVTYDHHMKMLGKPTSNEQKAHDILKKAWDAPGSPFKGTPFDPTKVNIAGVW